MRPVIALTSGHPAASFGSITVLEMPKPCRRLVAQPAGERFDDRSFHLQVGLRNYTVLCKHRVPLDLEIGLVPVSKGGQYPGLYLFAGRARMMRPVRYLANGRDDQVGSFEQVYMDIACTPAEIEDGVSTHVEHAPTNFLSILANLTPFSDFNQVRIPGFPFLSCSLTML